MVRATAPCPPSLVFLLQHTFGTRFQARIRPSFAPIAKCIVRVQTQTSPVFGCAVLFGSLLSSNLLRLSHKKRDL